MRYRSKPSEVEAVQWTGDNWEEVVEFLHPGIQEGDPLERLRSPLPKLMLRAGKDGAQDWVPVPVGHWIVRQPDDLSDHWPVDPDYFEAKYEPAG